MNKVPLLDLLASRDSQTSRKEHYARILCGEIYVDGQCVKDPRQPVSRAAALDHRLRRLYVSRGGEKLAFALERWQIDVRGLGFIDAGASTGGFTDCLLRHGASRVIAIERGRNQLDYRLRRDRRVTVLESTDLMSVRTLPFPPHAAVADLSLRSLRKAAWHLLGLVSRRWLIALVKPQYEWVDSPAGFDGVVSQQGALRSILESLFADLRTEGVFVRRLGASPLAGRKGNREFLCLLTTAGAGPPEDAARLIEEALEEAGRL